MCPPPYFFKPISAVRNTRIDDWEVPLDVQWQVPVPPPRHLGPCWSPPTRCIVSFSLSCSAKGTLNHASLNSGPLTQVGILLPPPPKTSMFFVWFLGFPRMLRPSRFPFYTEMPEPGPPSQPIPYLTSVPLGLHIEVQHFLTPHHPSFLQFLSTS